MRRQTIQVTTAIKIGGLTFLSIYYLVTFVVLWNIESTSRTAIPNIRGAQNKGFVATLRNKKILVEVTTIGLFQYSLTEDLLDSFRDLCETGAAVSLHIVTSNCDPNPKPGDPECPLYERAHDESTEENNYSVERLDQLNERLRCRDTDGSLDVSVHLVSPDWGKETINHHRRIFYENIDEGFDVFIHTEEDTLIRPTNILAFLEEMEVLRQRVGTDRLTDYSIGFMRYENEVSRDDRRRVIWEFDWEDKIEVLTNHSGIEGRYFSTPGPFHHQGMFMATPEQLLAWKNRGPDCHFDKITREPAYHRERTGGAMNLYDPERCNVTQLFPLESAEDFLVHHLPNKNFERTDNLISTMDLHQKRMAVLRRQNKKVWVDRNGKYNGVKMFLDEPDSEKFLPYNLDSYNEYVSRGGMLPDEQIER